MADKFDQELDCSGMSCPMPILKTKKAIDSMKAGEVLKMTATDPGSLPDIQAWTAKTGHELVSHETEGAKFIFYIKRK
jgi:tRNA 2-thiouridine synthesizing protein A